MIKNLGRYALVTAFALFLSGCINRTEQQPAPVDEVKPGTEQPVTPTEPVPTVPSVPTIPEQPGPIEHPDQTAQPTPRVRHYDWNGAMQPMVGKMLQAQGVTAGSVLLVDSVNNRTNGSLNAGEATETLRNALANNTTFQVVPADQVTSATQSLGLSPDDSLASVSKAIGLANIVKAQYVLYSTVSGDVKSPTMSMRLITAPSGEIVWSGRGAVQN